MRTYLVLLLSTSLAACGGAGVQTAGSTSTSSTSTTSQTGSGTSTTTPSSGHTFVNPTEPKTYQAIGSVHSFQYTTNDIDYDTTKPGRQSNAQQYNQIYAGETSTARNSGITVTYNPRDAIFDLVINESKANINETLRFQDPAHRTDFGGAVQPQDGVPNITSQNVSFLQASKGTGTLVYDPAQSFTFPVGSDQGKVETSTFFYQRPGTTTNYVTFAGFVRNTTNVAIVNPTDGSNSYLEQNHKLERGAFVFGERTANSAVPVTGSGTFTGPMLASIVYNPLIDTDARAPTYFQWITGSSTTNVNFQANTFTLGLTGTVTAPAFDVFTSRVFTLQNGASFNATGAGRIDLVNAGGFLGNFSAAYFTQPGGQKLDLVIAGSSIDGAFYGPAAQEVGGGFRIVGGNPDERIDILGAFTGKK